MRLVAPTWIALTLTAGCLRFGYDPLSTKGDSGVDSGMTLPDGSAANPDAANGGGDMDSGGMDAAAAGDAAVLDASDLPGDGGGSGNGATDAGDMLDAGMPDSGAIDAGTIDAGTIDSGTTDCEIVDSGVQASWTAGCPGVPDVLFCDSFEDGSLANKWVYHLHMNGSTARSTVEAHGPSYAMRATANPTSATARSHGRQSVTAFGHRKSGDLWARYYYFVPDSAELSQRIAIGVISSDQSNITCTGRLSFSVVIFADGVGIESVTGVEKAPLEIFPRNTWVCVEMHVKIDDSAGLFEFYMDGRQIHAFTGIDTLPDMGYTSFSIGVDYADFNQPTQITTYSDDVMLSTSQLGCN